MSAEAHDRSDGSWPDAALVASLRAQLGARGSKTALVLGSGLGGIADALEQTLSWGSDELPGYPRSHVAGHEGRLLLGRFGGRDLWVIKGRVHLYEGHNPELVTRYVRLLHALGVEVLILTNAAGSLTSEITPGSICRVDDVLNLFLRPLAVARESRAVWRAREPLVDRAFAELVREVAREERVRLTAGVLVGSHGPNYETAAEVRAARRFGGHVASMSTVPEALEARELGLRQIIFSLVTNLATGLSPTRLTHEEVVARADEAGKELRRLLEALVKRRP